MEPNEERTILVENLANEIRKVISKSGCTYKEVSELLQDMVYSYNASAMNRIVKGVGEDHTKST